MYSAHKMGRYDMVLHLDVSNVIVGMICLTCAVVQFTLTWGDKRR